MKFYFQFLRRLSWRSEKTLTSSSSLGSTAAGGCHNLLVGLDWAAFYWISQVLNEQNFSFDLFHTPQNLSQLTSIVLSWKFWEWEWTILKINKKHAVHRLKVRRKVLLGMQQFSCVIAEVAPNWLGAKSSKQWCVCRGTRQSRVFLKEAKTNRFNLF